MKYKQNNDIGRDAKNQSRGPVETKPVTIKHGPFALKRATLKTTFNTLAVAITLNLAGTNLASAVDIPSDLPGSSTFGALPFSQQMLRFEEFGLRPLPAPGSTAAKNFPLPVATVEEPDVCRSRPEPINMDAFLDAPIWPDPTVAANDVDENPWHTVIAPCQGFDPVTFTGVMEGRPPGINFSHQRWNEFFPSVYFESAMGAARAGTGIRDDEQSHGYTVGEFGPTLTGQTGLYHNVAGIPATAGTTAGLDIRFHPKMPVQDPNTCGPSDGTLPPKLFGARYGETMLFRHYNALPIAGEPTMASVYIPSLPTSTMATTRAKSTALPTPISSRASTMIIAGR